MDLILHIGAAKTGSTTIQDFLYINRENLQAGGFLLMESPGGYNNRALAAMCMQRNRHTSFYHFNHIYTLEQKEEYETLLLDRMDKELSDASKWAHTVISSSEDYYGGLLNLAEIARLKGILEPRFSRIRVVLYVRSQVETLSSLYSTFLKNGATSTLDEFIKERRLIDSNVYNLFQGVEMWSAVFGQENLSVRLFDRNAFHNGDLLEDFSNQLSPNIFQTLEEKIDVQNESLTRLGQWLALIVNKRLPAFSKESGWNEKNRTLITFISKYFAGKGVSVDSNTAASIEQLFSESNTLLQRKYFVENKELFKKK